MKFIVTARNERGDENFYTDKEGFSDVLEEVIAEGYWNIEVYAQISYKQGFIPILEGWED